MAQDLQDQVLSLEGQRVGDKRQRWEKGKGTRRGSISLGKEQDKGLPLGREETDVAHGKMAVYKGTRGSLC